MDARQLEHYREVTPISKNKLSAVEKPDATDAFCQHLNSLTLAESDKRFGALMHRFMSANERLKLAAAKLRHLEGEEEGLPQEYIPAAFVVEVMQAWATFSTTSNPGTRGLEHTPKAKAVQS